MTDPFAPYGRALCDHWDKKRAVAFHLRGAFGPWHRLSSAQGYEPIDNLRSLEEMALATCRGRVLDAGAGAGRHSLLLREAGCDVVSIDTDPALVDLMKRRGLREVYQADVFALDHGGFNTIVFLQRTIGLAGTLERLRELLTLLKSRLAPRGQIVLDSTYPRVFSSSVRYAGEETCQLRYRSLLGKPFQWLWIDFDVLSICGRAAGYDAELLSRGPLPADYLARLTPRP